MKLGINLFIKKWIQIFVGFFFVLIQHWIMIILYIVWDHQLDSCKKLIIKFKIYIYPLHKCCINININIKCKIQRCISNMNFFAVVAHHITVHYQLFITMLLKNKLTCFVLLWLAFKCVCVCLSCLGMVISNILVLFFPLRFIWLHHIHSNCCVILVVEISLSTTISHKYYVLKTMRVLSLL